MKMQNFIQSRFCFYSAHECLLQKEFMDLELVSGSKTEKRSSRHCYNNFQQNWDFKCNKIRLCRQRQMLNLFPKSQLHYPCISWITLLPYGSCRHAVPQGNGLFSLNHPIWGHMRLCPWGENALPKPNGWFPRVIHGYQLISTLGPFRLDPVKLHNRGK